MGVFGMNSYEIVMIILTALAVIIDLIKMNNENKKLPSRFGTLGYFL